MSKRGPALLILVIVLCCNLSESSTPGKPNNIDDAHLKTNLRQLKRLFNGLHETLTDHASNSLSQTINKYSDTQYESVNTPKHLKAASSSLCCGTDLCDIFIKYPQSQNWLSQNASCDFLQQLLGHGGKEIVNQFLHSYDRIPNMADSQKDSFLQSLLNTLSQQTFSNPSTSISHGTDHSVRVMGFAYQLQNAVLPYLSGNFGCTLDSANGTCLFLVMIASLIHDAGFQDYVPELQDFVYAPSGSLLDNSLFLNNSQLGLQILNNTGKNAVTISDSMLDAISLIPSYDQICMFRDSEDTIASACSTNATRRMKQYAFGSVYWKPYTEHSMEKEPFHAFLRLVDNLDITRDRLSSKQKNTAFIQFLFHLYTDQNLRKSGNDPAELVKARSRAINLTVRQYPTWNVTEFEDLIAVSDLSSFIEIYSYWVIEKVQVQWHSGNMGIYVKFHSLKGDCTDTYLAPKYHSGPALYRLNHLAAVAHSLYSQGITLSNQITVELSEQVAGANATLFPLRAFSPRIIYDNSGKPSDTRICGDSNSCALFLPLYNSPEVCFSYGDNTVSVETCQNIQNLGIPFSDLDYNSWLAVRCVESENSGIVNSEPSWCFPLSVAIPGALGLGLVILLTAFMYRRRKRRKDYETIADLDTPKRYKYLDED